MYKNHGGKGVQPGLDIVDSQVIYPVVSRMKIDAFLGESSDFPILLAPETQAAFVG
jgi:hypothetical protein